MTLTTTDYQHLVAYLKANQQIVIPTIAGSYWGVSPEFIKQVLKRIQAQ